MYKYRNRRGQILTPPAVLYLLFYGKNFIMNFVVCKKAFSERLSVLEYIIIRNKRIW